MYSCVVKPGQSDWTYEPGNIRIAHVEVGVHHMQVGGGIDGRRENIYMRVMANQETTVETMPRFNSAQVPNWKSSGRKSQIGCGRSRVKEVKCQNC